MIKLVGTSDSIAKFEKSDIFARMLNDQNNPIFRGRGKRNHYFGIIMERKLYIFGVCKVKAWQIDRFNLSHYFTVVLEPRGVCIHKRATKSLT